MYDCKWPRVLFSAAFVFLRVFPEEHFFQRETDYFKYRSSVQLVYGAMHEIRQRERAIIAHQRGVQIKMQRQGSERVCG